MRARDAFQQRLVAGVFLLPAGMVFLMGQLCTPRASSPTPFTLTVSTEGNGSVDPSGGQYDKGTALTLMATPAEGWSFAGWQGDATGLSAQLTLTMDKDMSVTAVFLEEDGGTSITHTLNVGTQGQGQITLDPSGGTYDHGTTVQLIATADAGWHFDYWQGHLSGSDNPATLIINQDRSVTAVFVQDPPAVKQYDLSVSTQGQGTVTVDPPGVSHDDGAVVTLTAAAASGWQFDHWEGGASGSENPVTVTLSADTTVKAVFVQHVVSPIVFRATYDRLWDTDQQNPGYGILKSVMSGDGNRLAWAIRDNDTGSLSILLMNVDGSDQTIIPAPAEADSIWELTANYDGSRVFFRRWFNLLFKVEGGAITKILDVADVNGLGSIESIQCTRSGDLVYFLDDENNDNDIWRCTHDGGTAELVVNDTNIILHNGYPAAQVADYSVSGDGGSVVFTTYAFWGSGGYTGRSEMFIQTGGGYTQLTTDGGDYGKSSPRISGDGSTIVFRRHNSWYSMSPDGTDEIELGPAGFNLGGPTLAYNGSKMFYSDSQSGGTVLLNTDGSGRRNIVPAWNITNIAIAATFHHAISDDATRVSFYTQYGAFPESGAFYVGYLEHPDILAPLVPDAPFVRSIAFGPGSFPRSTPTAQLLMYATVSDPDGLADVTNTAVDELIDGVFASYDAVPAYFYHSPRDDGQSPDEVAHDGIFVSSASAGDLLNTLNAVTIRVSAMDSDKTITVADVVLNISP